MVTFDLAAKVVTSQQSAWVAHAGRGMQHSHDFLTKNAVFLETPYLDLTGVDLTKRGDIRRAIRRSAAFDKHYNITGSSAPSAILSEYDDAPFDETGLTSLSGGVARMFGAMKPGDIVMSPGVLPGEEYNTPVIHFGEVQSAFELTDIISGSKSISQSVPYRKVRWLKPVPRKEISLYLDRKIGKPPALREIVIDRDTEEILQHAYPSYIFGETSSGMIEASKYDGTDFVTLTDAQRLIAAFVAAHHVFSSQMQVNQITDLDAFVRENFKNASVENIVVEFASPGFWQLVGASTSLAAFVGLGIAILTSDVDLTTLPDLLTVTNSISAPGQVEADIEENMKQFLRSIDQMQLLRAREAAQKAKEDIGLKSSVVEALP